MNATLAVLLLPMAALAQGYKAEQVVDHDVPIVRLTDAAHGVEVSIAPGIGNRAYEMKVHGKNILYFPFADVGRISEAAQTLRHTVSGALGGPVE